MEKDGMAASIQILDVLFVSLVPDKISMSCDFIILLSIH